MNMSKDKKPTKKYAPTKIEVAKTVTIAVLVTGIIAFALGMSFADAQNKEVLQATTQTEVEQVETSAKK